MTETSRCPLPNSLIDLVNVYNRHSNAVVGFVKLSQAICLISEQSSVSQL